MKTTYKNLKYFYCFLIFLATSSSAHAGLGEAIKDWLIDRIPFIGTTISKYRLEDKINQIKQVQKTGLDQLRDLARQAIKTKEKVEEMYYFTQQGIRIADDLRENLQSGKGQKLLGALVERWIGISVNPADYIPETPLTKQLKENIAWDLSAESGLVRQHEYFLQGTRAALLAQPDFFDKGAEQFNQAYQEAVRYEQELEKALSAKKQATIKSYTANIVELEEEISVLEKTKKQEGLTIGDVMQIQMAIDTKKHIIRELNEKITKGIEEEMQPTEEQQETLDQQKAAKDMESTSNFHSKERARMHKKYSHLWRFW